MVCIAFAIASSDTQDIPTAPPRKYLATRAIYQADIDMHCRRENGVCGWYEQREWTVNTYK